MLIAGLPLLFMLAGCSLASEWGGGAYAAEATDGVLVGDVGQGGGDLSETPVAKSPDASAKPAQPAEATKPPADKPKPPASKPANRKVIALTFDDGPDGKYTPKVLDVLKQYQIKATFFLVGSQVEKYPDVVKRIVDEGHDIGNHSWSHKDLSKLDAKALDEQLARTQQAIEKASGFVPDLVRAPYGAISPALIDYLHDNELKHVAWTVDPKDWAGTSVSVMRDNIRKHAKPGGIILLHSFGGRKNALDHTLQLLPLIIGDLQKAGYEFATVDDMIGADLAKASAIK